MQNELHEYTSSHYETLPRRRGAIRLLTLMPSDNPQSEVLCELKTPKESPKNHEIETHAYEALSWCWGTGGQEAHISIRKGDMVYAKKVSPNLLAALKALRNRFRVRYLWVDAVCINQEHLEEKNHQVEMMSDIYGNAGSVCIWLGEATESSQRAIKFIKEDVLKLQDFDTLCESEQASKKWQALLEMMQRPWFSRRWVVQEIALAKSAVIYCGDDRISWRDFAVAVELFVEVETATHRLSEVMKRDREGDYIPGWFEHVSALGASLLVDATERLYRDYKDERETAQHAPFANGFLSNPRNETGFGQGAVQGERRSGNRNEEISSVPKHRMRPLLSLEYLVSCLTIFETSVPHDTIYALLAIAKDTTPSAVNPIVPETQSHAGLEIFTQRKRYKVSYELPYADVCKEFIHFSIKRSLQVDPTRALDVICRPWATEEKHLQKRREQAQKKQQGLGGQDQANLEDIPLPSWVPQLSNAPFGMYPRPGMAGPKMNRKNADPLVGLPTLTQRCYAAAETKGVNMKKLRFQRGTRHYSMYIQGFCLDTVSEVGEIARKAQIPREWTDLGGWEDRKGPVPDSFWRTLVADRGKDGKNPPMYYAKACEETFKKGGYESGAVDTADLIHYERNSIVAQFCRRVQSVVWNRAMILTREKRLGLVSGNVKKDDKVCILYGCSVPVILRQVERETPSEADLDWELLSMRNLILERFKEVKSRKAQHLKHKDRAKAQIYRQCRKHIDWQRAKAFSMLAENGETVEMTPWNRLIKLSKIFRETYSMIRQAQRYEEWWPWLEQQRKKEVTKPVIKPVTHPVTKPSTKPDFYSTTQWFTDKESKKGEKWEPVKGPKWDDWRNVSDEVREEARNNWKTDWFEFELQLKFFREWKLIVKKRKEKWMACFATYPKKPTEPQQGNEREDRSRAEVTTTPDPLASGPSENTTVMTRAPSSEAGIDSTPAISTNSPSSDNVGESSRTMKNKRRKKKSRGSTRKQLQHQKGIHVDEETGLRTVEVQVDTSIRPRPGVNDDDTVAGAEAGPSDTVSQSRTIDMTEKPLLGDSDLGVTGRREKKAPKTVRSGNNNICTTTPTEPPDIAWQTDSSRYDNGSVIDTASTMPSSGRKLTKKLTDEQQLEFKQRFSEDESMAYDTQIREYLKSRFKNGDHHSYEMLGECYIHGMMDGDAMWCKTDRGIKDEVFEIR